VRVFGQVGLPNTAKRLGEGAWDMDEHRLTLLQYADFEALASEHLATGSYKSNTRRTYGKAYDLYREWCGVAGLAPLVASEDDIARFISHRQAETSRRTAAHARSALISLFEFVRKKGLRDDNPVEAIPTYSPDRNPNRDYLRRDELEAMLAAASDHPTDRAVIVLSAVNGLREQDLHSADISDVRRSPDGGQWSLRLRAREPIGETPLPPIALDAVMGAIGDRTAGPLILNRAGNRIHQMNSWRVIRRVGERAGIERSVTHSLLLASMARLAFERGARMDVIGQAVGRRDMKSVVSMLGDPSGRHPANIVADALSGTEGQGSILDTADDFLSDAGIEPAIPTVVAGVALEIHLREMCQANELEVAGRKRGIGAYCDALKDKGILPKAVWRQVYVWDDLRNKAAHGELDGLDRESADGMVRGIRRFLARYPAS
jgi:site-specific recombinase XerD